MIDVQPIRNALGRGLIVSCQPGRGGPFDSPEAVAGFALAALAGGASAIRVEGLRDIRAVRRVTDRPIIGLVKTESSRTGVYITPTVADVLGIIQAGADVVAFDATSRPRETPVCDIIACVVEHGRYGMADVATLAEGLEAFQFGSTFVATTLSGYTSYSPAVDAPDLDLVRNLAEARVCVVAEGRYNTPELAHRALQVGAHAVTVGTMITRPECITAAFVVAMRAAASDATVGA